MLHLNLVSKELKKEIKLAHIYKLMNRASHILILLTIFIAIAILVSKIILQNNFNRIVEETTLITRESQGRNNQVREINNKLSQVDKIQTDFINWSFLIEDVFKFAGDNISFYSIKITKQPASIKIKGKAGSRDKLLAFKKSFEDSEIMENIDFPITNILEKENIDFEIKADLNLGKIKLY